MNKESHFQSLYILPQSKVRVQLAGSQKVKDTFLGVRLPTLKSKRVKFLARLGVDFWRNRVNCPQIDFGYFQTFTEPVTY